jgi:hypothetical protein
MPRRALVALPISLLLVVSCSGSPDVASARPCAPDLCGAPGEALTVSLTSFDHASDILEGDVGARAVALRVTPATQPLPAPACDHASQLAALFRAWNETAPIDPVGHFDLFDYDGDYHRLLVAIARAGAAASITLAADMTTVETLQPLCPQSS